MRQTLIFGGLECIAYNINRQNPDLKLFEFGNCYFYKGSHLKENPLDNYLEEEHLALFITGSRETKNWTNAKAPVSFFLIKKYAENILSRLGFDLKLFSVNETSLELLSDGLTYSLYNIKVLDIGIVARSILKKTNVANPVYYADFNWNVLLTEHRRFKNAFTELPRYPEVSRDLALILDKKIKFNQIRSIAFKTERSILQAVDLFDVYEGKGIPEGKKSYALNFVLRDDKQTLNDKQIDKVMQRLVESFERQTGAILRGPETA
jgi:phenylalanyl-tRNA synthetase beta chain